MEEGKICKTSILNSYTFKKDLVILIAFYVSSVQKAQQEGKAKRTHIDALCILTSVQKYLCKTQGKYYPKDNKLRTRLLNSDIKPKSNNEHYM